MIIITTIITRDLEGPNGGSQGMGVVSDNRFDRVSLSILYVFKPSC